MFYRFDDIHRIGCSATYRIDYQRDIKENECYYVKIRKERSAELDVALVEASVFFPAEEIEHQGETDYDVDYRERFVFDYQAEKEKEECQVRQHIWSQCRHYTDSFAFHRTTDETQSIVAVRK